uniref:Uncharacterized protein n=1 Tax=Amphimedon queenslandica TaxID=400682 RepID=A0A1X7TF11_AMPQE
MTDPDQLKRQRLEQLKRGLQETHAKLNKLEEDIMPHIDPGDVATEIEASERINDELFAAMAKVEHVLASKAQEAIAGMPLTDANYTSAVDLLQRRFKDKERIIAAHMDTLMSLEPVVSEHHLIELRRLYDKTELSNRSLDALGVKPEAYGALLIPVFVKKMPSELRLIITRRVPMSGN